MSTSYIPAKDADFSAWILNFSTLVTANYAAYGLTSSNATAIAAQNTAWQAAYTLAVDPSTRTPQTVAAKDTARINATGIVRPFAMAINANAGVSNAQRTALGITVRKTVPTPIPAPTDAPALALVSGYPGQVNMQYKNPNLPDGKAKPYGAVGMQVWASVGTVAATDPAQADYMLTVTKSPFVITLPAGSNGKVVTTWGRFQTRSGPGGQAQVGPWSPAIVCNAM